MSTPIPEGRYVQLDSGLKIHYHEAGAEHAGVPVIFLHGSGPGASGYSNFKGNYPEFAAAGMHVLVPDMPGFGLSSKPEEAEYVLDFFVEALHGFIQGLGIERCILLGNSLGGAIALGYALAHPGKVASLVLMAPGGVEEREAYFAMAGMQEMVSTFTSGPMDESMMRRVLSLLVHDPAIIDEALVQERYGVCETQPRTVLSTMRVPNMTDRLHEIECPVLGFWGVNDDFNPVGGNIKLLEGCLDARFVLLNRCGHWVQAEYRDYFNQECIQFLQDRSLVARPAAV